MRSAFVSLIGLALSTNGVLLLQNSQPVVINRLAQSHATTRGESVTQPESNTAGKSDTNSEAGGIMQPNVGNIFTNCAPISSVDASKVYNIHSPIAA